jgi:hypothetical protein
MTNILSVHPSPGLTDHIVVGLLPNLDAARRALESLRSHGLSDDCIGLAMRHTEQDALSHANAAPSPTVDDTAKGAVGGSIVGGLAGLLTATGLIAVPGLAPLLAGGALVSLLGTTGASIVAGGGVGAVAGGLVGALVSINVPETAARQYETAVQEGKILITVRTGADAAKIQELLVRHGAETGVRS